MFSYIVNYNPFTRKISATFVHYILTPTQAIISPGILCNIFNAKISSLLFAAFFIRIKDLISIFQLIIDSIYYVSFPYFSH